ncbi:sugar phosphate isomerase/epimerase [uncultured Paludibaculum sp.]|uniref:sugar phosphate isomerase/epimerase family protein n=1 Tax=uncultured Paludibaculum sp. TaxID=1765020 RepID=UPI002AAC1252|nr:sugar phosphate isomerase/epimerase [uncultured Paludibaculum sp.]
MLSRRNLIAAALSAPLGAAGRARIKIGAMDGVLGKRSDPSAVEIASRLGVEGLQVTLGRVAADGHLVMANAALQGQFLANSKQYKVPLVATYIDILHVNCLKSDPEALKWGAEGIEITRRLDAKILMLVFFGKCALTSRAEMDAVVGPLKELCREAEKARITLGFENTIPAGDDLRILDQVGSPALKVWYDIGNATNQYNVDPAQEIRQLGRERICQLHFKDKGYLGEGAVNVKAALAALNDIRYEGYVTLETNAPSKDVEEDLRRNVKYLRRLL